MTMKVDFTTKDADTFVQFLQSEHDIVRFVDPVSQHVYNADGALNKTSNCSDFWGRCNRCENCTSLRALEKRTIAYKLELLDSSTYLVMSRYMNVSGQERILEVVTNITDNLIMDSDELSEVGKLISNYNYQLTTDPLTDIYNRRFLDEFFLPSLGCCHEEGLTVNIALMDLDDFKSINDTHGHLAGDALLKDVAGFWKRRFNSRTKNKERLTVRYGGDEILLIACDTDPKKFESAVRERYGQMRKVCYFSQHELIPFSISFGFASSDEVGDDWTWDQLFNLADKRLYAAKAKAR